MKDHIKAVLSSYPDIFFLQSGLLGAAFFAIMLANPNVALAGVVCVLAAYCFARFIHMETRFLKSGHYTYNPLLVGLSLGYLLKLTPLTAFFVVASGIFTFILTVFMASLFQTYLKLPVLSLPFVVASSIIYLASLRYSNLLVAEPGGAAILAADLNLPLWIAGFFKSFGAILFAPTVVVGLIFSILLLCASRILFLLAVLGYYVGTSVRALMLGSIPQAFGDLNSFNFILIAMCVGGVFLIPSLRSYLMAAIAVTIATVFLDAITAFWYQYGIPAFALPFNLTCLGLIYVLGLMNYPMIARCIRRTPEETLEYYLADRLRYRGELRTLYLPFSGKWAVWQGFDGKWTHKGSWRYAYDFVVTDDRGSTCRGHGDTLEDYYAFGKPVLAPVRGRVTRIIDNVPDSPVGDVDKSNNWGNLVIIEDPRGFYVEISHLAERSIRVKEGDWVERGTVLGLCGNSGYSPQPHIHVQVQATGDLGAGTLPFSFASYSAGDTFHANDRPGEHQHVEPLYTDKRLDSVTNFILDDAQEYDVRRRGETIDRLSLKVRMALDGTFYFDSGRGKLYFGKYEGTLYFYRVEGDDPWLRRLFISLPRLPLAYREGLSWRDYVPVGLALSGPRRMFARFLSSFYPALAEVRTTLTFAADNSVRSCIESRVFNVKRTAQVQLDSLKGLARIAIGDIELTKVANSGPTKDFEGAMP